MSKLEIEVKRIRTSVTLGTVDVYINGTKAVSIEDEMSLIPEGGLYYGEIIDGWASTASDADFIMDVIVRMSGYEQYEQVTRPFLKELEKIRVADVKKRPEQKTIEMIQDALRELHPFYEERRKEILNTEIDGHRMDLCVKQILRHSRNDTDSAKEICYKFNLYVDGVYIDISGEWTFKKIQKQSELIVSKIMEAWEYALHLMEES